MGEELTEPEPAVPVPGGSGIAIDYCGEWLRPAPDRQFVVGRGGDLEIDDNPYLHRRFLVIERRESLWWLVNVGARLSATICDQDGGAQSWLPPGAQLPIVFGVTLVVFTAGPTTYEFSIHLDSPAYQDLRPDQTPAGHTTMGDVEFTPSQLKLILALSEPMLLRDGTTATQVPPSSRAAERLGWTQTRFNRKLDNVCDKLDQAGVRGLKGGRGKQAMSRRARLAEWAVTTRLVTREDLPLLDTHTDDEDLD